MRLFFLCSYLGKKTGVCGLVTCWHRVLWDEVDDVGAAPSVFLDVLVNAFELLCIGRFPGCSVGAVD